MHVKDPVVHVRVPGRLWKYENNQHALIPPEDGMWLPKVSVRGIENGHIRYPSMEENKNRKQR